MYTVMIYSDSTDPWAYGPFKSLKAAEKFKKEYQATWDSRNWYELEDHIIMLKKGSK